jgi:outer membrane protein OmpA-like peptidoglycan-associated protein
VRASAWSLLLVAALAAGARAHPPAASGLPTASDGYGLFAVDRADVDPQGELGLRLDAAYLRAPLRLRLDGSERLVVNDAVVGRLGVHLGIVERLEIGLVVPVSVETYSHAGAGLMSGAGTSTRYDLASEDLRLFLKLALVRGERVGLSVLAGPLLATGDSASFRTDGVWGAEVRLLLDLTLHWLSVLVNAGARLHDTFAVADVAGRTLFEIGPELTWGAALAAEVHRKLSIAVEGAGSESLPGFGREARTLAILASLRARPTTALNLFIGGGRSLASDAARGDDFRLLAGIAWHPLGGRAGHAIAGEGDRDGDGVPDHADACPDEPEDKDGFEDQDGCPDPDNDRDGIVDGADRCPDQPEDKDGFEDQDGCPDPDNDHDGVPDAVDRCPDVPEPADGFQDGDGCPNEDVDGDGIPNARDACPYEAETRNGFQDDDGCPDTLPATRDESAPPKGVRFAANSAALDAAARKTVEALAAYLARRPDVKRVRLEGHADAREHRRRERAEGRAQAVRAALIARGVAPERLEAVGYAATRPAGSAEANRRVEWIAVDVRK